jgi:hypothetical protein
MLSLLRVGMATSLFFLITYVICVVGYLILPEWLMIPHNSLELFLPGFKLLTFGSFVLGAIEAYVFGWYVGALFGVLYNYVPPETPARGH